MISKQTAIDIWSAYQEIEVAEKLLVDLAEAIKERRQPNWRDAFGQTRGLELGVPTDRSSTRLFQVDAKLAQSIIRSHIGNEQKKLVDANERARIELEQPIPAEKPSCDPGF